MNDLLLQQKWMVQVLNGPSSIREFELDTNQSYVMGRREQTSEWQPDLDLFPDTAVSRRHAQLRFMNGTWHIEDCGSKGGTRVDGREIQGAPHPTNVSPGAPIQMGETTWILSYSDICRSIWHDVCLELRVIPVITYSLYHCNIPVISQVQLENTSSIPVGPFHITFSVPGYSYPSQVICKEIKSETTHELGTVPILLNYEKLEGQMGRKRVQLEVRIDDALVLVKEVEILGFYDWPIHSAYRKSLACFVQPSDPLITAVVGEATRYLVQHHFPASFASLLRSRHDNTTHVILKSIYQTLRDRYDIRYVPAGAGSEPRSQSIRPPNRIMTNQKVRQGEGTCIDLAILVASALENITVQPFIVLLRESTASFHALVGCWSTISPRVEPIITTFDRLNRELDRGGIIVLEATGFTDRFIDEWGQKLTFEEALDEAISLVNPKSFVFALDIAAARQTVTPLHMPMEPAALRVVRAAEQSARDEGSERLETKHLFTSLIAEGAENVDAFLEKAGANVTLLLPLSTQLTLATEIVPVPTVNYRRCLEDARIAAADCGVTFVGLEHLLYALLQSQSPCIDRLWQSLGTTRNTALKAFNRHFLWTADLVETYFE